MQIIDNLIILCLPVLAFWAGKHIADRYNSEKIAELEYMLRSLLAEKGVGYVAPVPKRRVPIGQPFMDVLKENGRAVQKINPQP